MKFSDMRIAQCFSTIFQTTGATTQQIDQFCDVFEDPNNLFTYVNWLDLKAHPTRQSKLNSIATDHQIDITDHSGTSGLALANFLILIAEKGGRTKFIEYYMTPFGKLEKNFEEIENQVHSFQNMDSSINEYDSIVDNLIFAMRNIYNLVYYIQNFKPLANHSVNETLKLFYAENKVKEYNHAGITNILLKTLELAKYTCFNHVLACYSTENDENLIDPITQTLENQLRSIKIHPVVTQNRISI